MFDSPLITVEELSKLIRKSVPSIYSDLHRNPSALPPIIRLPGSRRVLFDPEAVKAWIVSHTTIITETSERGTRSLPRVPDVKKKKSSRPRGRPTKAEQIAHARGGNGQ